MEPIVCLSGLVWGFVNVNEIPPIGTTSSAPGASTAFSSLFSIHFNNGYEFALRSQISLFQGA